MPRRIESHSDINAAIWFTIVMLLWGVVIGGTCSLVGTLINPAIGTVTAVVGFSLPVIWSVIVGYNTYRDVPPS